MLRLQTVVLESCGGPSLAKLLEVLPEGGRPVLLDSSDGSGWSLLAWDPDCVLEGNLTQNEDSSEAWPLAKQDPAQLLEEISSKEIWEPASGLPPEAWSGGWIGWFSFECGHAWEAFPWAKKSSTQLPDFSFARYRKAIAQSPDGTLFLCYAQDMGHENSQETSHLLNCFHLMLEETESIEDSLHEASSPILGPLISHSSPMSFQKRVSKLRDWIGEGELFQANLSHAMEAECLQPPRNLYSHVRREQSTSMSAYWEDEQGHAMLSWSPERFLQVDGEYLQTRPIKGTAPRGLNELDDENIALALEKNEKERAELTMIVDMARNDLGRVAQIGKVRVRSSGEVERFSTLHHRTAVIEAEWNPSDGIASLFRATYPPASVTGAPKVRALQAISELEEETRGVYCGSFGIWQPGPNRGDFSVLIRTAIWSDQKLHLRVGAGIVWDSDPKTEWNETLLKARYLEKAATLLCS
ncbi:MAG: hypothetical protein CMJ96_05960 [Planctomycetes bacterium]|nr:hypothetical protein [Planctomycetota bacterium]